MDTASLVLLFVFVAIVVSSIMFVLRPIFRVRRTSLLVESEHELSALLAERDRAVNALNELDFDHALGKIPAEDYPVQREALLRHGADVLRRLDELQPSGHHGQSAETRLEAAIAARRADMAVKPGEQSSDVSDEDIENLLATRRNARQEKSGGFCPKCGRAVLKSDKFCPHCGKPI